MRDGVEVHRLGLELLGLAGRVTLDRFSGEHIGEETALVGRVGRVEVVDVGVGQVPDGERIVEVGVAVALAVVAADAVGLVLAGLRVLPEDPLGAEAALRGG